MVRNTQTAQKNEIKDIIKSKITTKLLQWFKMNLISPCISFTGHFCPETFTVEGLFML